MIDGHLHLAYVRVLVVPGQHLERVLTVTSSRSIWTYARYTKRYLSTFGRAIGSDWRILAQDRGCWAAEEDRYVVFTG